MATFRIEAEALTIGAGFVVNNLGAASGGQVLKGGASGEQRAGFAFAEVDGLYDVDVGYFDENDGVATLELRVNGVTIESWAWNQNLGSANANSSDRRPAHDPKRRDPRRGHRRDRRLSNAGEPLRTDFLDFTRTGDITGGDTAPPVVQGTAAADITTAGATTHTITVTFVDNVALTASSFDPADDLTITGPGGATLTVLSAQVNNPADGSPRTVTYTVDAPGDAWDAADNGSYTVTLNAGQVLDTSGNAASARHLDDFEVSIATAPTCSASRPRRSPSAPASSSTNLGAASGGQVLKGGGSGEQRASFSFAEIDGLYDVDVSYFDENDGVATLELRVNGVTIESWAWNQNLGSANATSSTAVQHTIRSVAIRAGDTVEIAGFSNAGEPLRTDFLDFTRTGDITGGDTAPPVVQGTAAADITTAGATTHTITVTFVDNVALTASSFDPADVTITGPAAARSRCSRRRSTTPPTAARARSPIPSTPRATPGTPRTTAATPSP